MSKHILFVEDEELFSGLLMEYLQKAGFKVTLAKDGIEALQRLKDIVPDLVLLDLFLPYLNGFEVLHHVRSNPATAFVPVIILSNLSGEENVKKGLALGASEYLLKVSLTPHQIVDKVKENINKPIPDTRKK